MFDFLTDLKVALRSYARTPGLALVAVLSLGLGIGAMSTVYLWMDSFVVNPLPGVPDPGRLVVVKTQAPGGDDDWSISYPTYRDWAERSRGLHLAVQTLQGVGVKERDGEGVERAWATLVSGNFFEVLGSRAGLGRTFQPDEEDRAAQVVVLGNDYWRRRFRADSGIVGRRIIVNGQSFEVVGVMPPRFGGGYVGLDLDLYALVTTFPAILGDREQLTRRGNMFLEGIARLAPGSDLAMARSDLARVGKDLDAIYPDGSNHALVMPLDSQGAPRVMKPVFLALLAVTVLVLLIACANVANLLLARATARRKEIGVRIALGAGRGRLVRQLLTESVVLAAGGAFLGLGIAFLGRNGIAAILPPVPYPVALAFELNGRVILFAVAAATATVFLFGLWPALRVSRPDLIQVLKDLPAAGRIRSGARAALVAGQLALAVIALVSAGLFLRAIERSRSIDPGFRAPDSVLLVGTDLTIAGLGDSTGSAAVDRLLARINQIPGVAGAAAASFVPLGWSCCSSTWLEVEGYTPSPDENMSVPNSRIAGDYFATLGITPLSGRVFTAGDGRNDPPVMIVNQAFARRFFGGKDPVGRKVKMLGREAVIVGLVPDGKYRTLVERPFPLVYRPLAQRPSDSPVIHVRAAGDPVALVPALRQAFEAESGLPFLDVRTLRQHMQQSTIGQEIGSRALTAFGGVALLLATIGIYGVMAYLVGQRTREIGLRVALGAATGSVARMVVRDGLRIGLVGGLVGTLGALGTGRLLQGFLLGVSPADPVTFGVIVALVFAVVVVACLLPARRAARIDPIVALKAD